MSTCEFTELDGAYVLGALSPVERQEFENHLATCETCCNAVRELAGMPGLLSRVDPIDLEPADGPVPDTLLPALVREVRHIRRRRVYATVGVAAAAAVAVGAVLVQGVGSDSPSVPTHSSGPRATVAVGESMRPIGQVPVTATLAFTPVSWGTKLQLTCTYEHPPGEDQTSRSETFGLFVVNRDGKAEQVGTWRALDGKTMRLTAGTAEPRGDISSVEVRTAEGRPVLQLAS